MVYFTLYLSDYPIGRVSIIMDIVFVGYFFTKGYFVSYILDMTLTQSMEFLFCYYYVFFGRKNFIQVKILQ